MALSTGSHGIIVIHGIGESQKRGDLLAKIANSLADTLLESPVQGDTGSLIYPVIEREVDITSDPPSVTLRITAPDKKKAVWVCKEAIS